MFSKLWLLVSLVWGIVCGFVFLKEGGSFIFVDFLLPLFVMYCIWKIPEIHVIS